MNESGSQSISLRAARCWVGLAGWLLLCFSAALVGGLFMPGEWYAQLRKPSWNPPNWIFGPVWTALYALMAVAGWQVWRLARGEARTLALALFLGQLVLNAAWSPLFFGLRAPGLAFAEIIMLWIAILGTIRAFWPLHRLAAALLFPYLAWVTFAGFLNFTLWRLNS